MTETVNPYRIDALRNAAGQLDAELISKTFGFARLDLTQVDKRFLAADTTCFEDVAYHHGCDLLARLAQAVLMKIGVKPGDTEEKSLFDMRNFMQHELDGITPLDRLRKGEGVLVLEQLYGGLRKDTFEARPEEDEEIAHWLGLEPSELRQMAVLNGLAVLEAIASCVLETGWQLAGIDQYYSLAEGGPKHLPESMRDTRTACLVGGRGLTELYNVSKILELQGKRYADTSPLLSPSNQVLVRT